ncbi:MAG: DUF2150 family protein [Candidatus Helarchaeota archaeon]|nr:DUF2150 family protein [Candidatus Helarchaeota archaeon]
MNFEDILDSAVKVAVYAAEERTERAQINQLLEKLESETKSKGVIITIIHILRQVEREKFGKKAANEIIKNLKEFLDQNPETAKNNARELLGLVKWLYDGNRIVGLRSNQIRETGNFNTLLQEFLRR